MKYKIIFFIVLIVVLFNSTQLTSADPNTLPTGGDSFDNAVEIQLGEYEGRNLESHEVEYFYITGIKPGQQVNIRSTFTSSSTYGACAVIYLYDENRVKLHGIYEAPYGTDTYSFFWTPNSDSESYKYFIKIGSDYNPIYSYTFKIWIEDYYDANSGTDAGDGFDTALRINAGDYQGFLAGTAGDDHEDVYVISLGNGQQLDVKLIPASDASYKLEIYNQDRIQVTSAYSANDGAISTTSWTAPSAQGAYVKIIRDYYTSSRTYSLSLSVKGGEAPEITHGTDMHLSMNAPASMDQGNTMVYTLFYNNFGSIAASNVTLQATIPSNVDFVSISDEGTYDSDKKKAIWNIGTVPAFPLGRGSKTITVRIPNSTSVETVIKTVASISTSAPETRYEDNSASAKTKVTTSNLPPDVGVGPTLGNLGGTPSVYWRTPITFTYYNPTATGVNIRIHLDDGEPDITGNMTGGPPDWTYTTTLYPRHGRAAATYIVNDPTPYSSNFDVRNMRGFENSIEADEIDRYIREGGKNRNYLNNPMPTEAGIGQRFIDAGRTYNITPAFLVATAEWEGNFGTGGWAASHPNAHNTMGWGIYEGHMYEDWGEDQPGPTNAFNSWEECIEFVARRIAASDGNFYGRELYTVGKIREMYVVGPKAYTGQGHSSTQGIVDFMNALAESAGQAGEFDENFNLYIDPAGYIYDVATGERISDAAVWLQRSDGQGGWENIPIDQTPPIMQPDVNPLFTGADGQYQWDVLEGSYRVHVEVPGYYSVDSIVVSIPPPVTDLHVGLTPLPDNGIPWIWVCVGIAVVIIAIVVLIRIRKRK